MKFSSEQLEKAKAAKSVEELLGLAKESGIETTEEEASKYFAELHAEGELTDDELDNISGGCSEASEPEPEEDVPALNYWDVLCNNCGKFLGLGGGFPNTSARAAAVANSNNQVGCIRCGAKNSCVAVRTDLKRTIYEVVG